MKVIVATWVLHSGRPNPSWLISPVDLPRIGSALSGDLDPRRAGPADFDLGCFLLLNAGGVEELPERLLVDRRGLCAVSADGVECREDPEDLFGWLATEARRQGY